MFYITLNYVSIKGMSIKTSLKFGGVNFHLSIRKWIQNKLAAEFWRRWMYDLMFYYILSLDYENFCFFNYSTDRHVSLSNASVNLTTS